MCDTVHNLCDISPVYPIVHPASISNHCNFQRLMLTDHVCEAVDEVIVEVALLLLLLHNPG